MRLRLKKATACIVAYVGLWVITWWHAPIALQKQILEEAIPAWRRDQVSLKDARTNQEIAPRDFRLYERGPVVKVELVLCPIPLLIKANCTKSINGLNGHSWTGWYLVTPWHSYFITGETIWVS